MAVSLTRKDLDAMRFLNGEVPTSITLAGTDFLANGHPILTEVPSNIVATPSPYSFPDNTKNNSTADHGCFVGFDVGEPSSCHVVPIGKLSGVRFMSIFRFKLWWSTHWVGSSGREVQYETQMMVLDKSDLGRPYVILLPIIEGSFSSSLQPGIDDNVDICVERGHESGQGTSGDIQASSGEKPTRHSGQIRLVHLGCLFSLRTSERCVGRGQGPGCPPGMLIIDDGWQSICLDDDPIDNEGIDRTANGEEKPYRLVKFQENYRFKDFESTKTPSNKGMGAFVKELKEEFKTVKDVYVWQALCGYWGGIRPKFSGMPESRIVKAHASPSMLKTMKDFAGLHSHLESVGIDGVKIDVIEVLELLSEDYGGHVELSKAYFKALTASLRKHFNGNGVISSMQQASDFFFLGTETIALGRAGDDFWCIDPYGDPTGIFWLQGCHMVHCAYNSLWMGNFIHPDWDMFQSHHPCAKFHAASLAISGGPVYVSDFVGEYNFDLLKKLALPDGSILRCQHYALPTRDCLFEDPLHDGITALKIWNLNKYSGVIGLFNCQGGGRCPHSRRNKSAPEFANPVYQSKKLKLMKSSEQMEVALEPLNYELLTVSPVAILPKKQIQFAPIGLVNMLNSGGAIQSLAFDGDENLVRIGVKGRGELRVFASEKPWACKIDGVPVEFGYDEQMVRIEVPGLNSPLPPMVEYFF
ncbi:Raffinose synthase family protein, putative [Theobroma cacao]|uniref:Raffinose synthase family protein, putative n=1 Tax=Theobroma cacao TaxID=3641 RepID=A0A061FUV8_THECC|nr:Raffinose synthase family protein, putative [Theobroma cacao]